MSDIRHVRIFPVQGDKSPTVVQANDLVMGYYKVTPMEFRLLKLAQSKIYSVEYPDYGDLTIDVAAEDFKNVFNVTRHSIYDELKSASKKLLKRQVYIKTRPNEDFIFNWVDYCHYFHDEHRIRMRFTSTAVEYLCSIKGNYTSIELFQYTQLQTFPGMRLYEFLMRFRDTRSFKKHPDELRLMFGAENKYPKFAHFMQRVLEPAIKDVNDNTDTKVELEVQRYGRNKVSMCVFTHRPKDDYVQPDLFKFKPEANSLAFKMPDTDVSSVLSSWNTTSDIEP